MLMSLRIPLLVLICSTFLGCAKSEEEKAKDTVTQYNSLVQDLNSSTPSDGWTDQQLTTYERKLDRLVQLEAELDSANSKQGIVIIGGDNYQFVAQRRTMIANIRAKRNVRTQSPQPQPPQPEKRDKDIIEQLQQLNEDIRTDAIERVYLGDPNSSWDIEKLTSYKVLTSKIIENCEKLIELAYELPATAQRTEVISNISEIKYRYEVDLGDVNELLSRRTPLDTDRR
jgi:hypothetical protein